MINLALEQVLVEVGDEFNRATAKFGGFGNPHEGYAVILEELDELWDEIKVKAHPGQTEKMKKEATQVAAMAIRFIYDLCSQNQSGE